MEALIKALRYLINVACERRERIAAEGDSELAARYSKAIDEYEEILGGFLALGGVDVRR